MRATDCPTVPNPSRATRRTRRGALVDKARSKADWAVALTMKSSDSGTKLRFTTKNPPNGCPAGSGLADVSLLSAAHCPPPDSGQHMPHSVPMARVVITVFGMPAGKNMNVPVYYGPTGSGYGHRAESFRTTDSAIKDRRLSRAHAAARPLGRRQEPVGPVVWSPQPVDLSRTRNL